MSLSPIFGIVSRPLARLGILSRAAKITLFISVVTTAGCGGSADAPGTISASGTIEATEIHIASKQPGQLLSVLVDDGSAVHQGDLIATVDHTAPDLQLREVSAAVQAAKAQLSLTERGARREDIAQAEAAVTEAKANRELAAKEVERARTLTHGNAMTQEQLDAAENRFRLADSRFAQAQENLQKVSHLARPEEVSAAAARVEQLQAARDRVSTAISDCYITAPSNGIIENRVLEPGEIATQGSTVATLIDPSTVHLMLYVPETALARVKVGQTVDVTVDGSTKTYRGTVTYISPQAEFTPKNVQTKDDRTTLVFAVKVQIPNPTGDLKAGLPADAVIRTRSSDRVK